MDGMTRGEIAEKADVNPETLRYYEREELIPKPPRSDGGFRLYDESYVDRLRFIQRAQDLGFTLAEIKDLLELRVDDGATCRDVKAQAEEKIGEVKAKIQDLKRIRDALSRLAEACEESEGPTSACPILEQWKAKPCAGPSWTAPRPPVSKSPMRFDDCSVHPNANQPPTSA